MRLEELPIEIIHKLFVKCPQLRFVFSELRILLLGFIKPSDLEYPNKKNKHKKQIIIEHNGFNLEFRNKNIECIDNIYNTSKIQCITFHKILPLLFTGCNNGFISVYELNNDFIKTRCIRCIKGHNDIILSIAFHNLSLIFATSSIDFTIKLWNFNYKETLIQNLITITEPKSYLKKILFHPFLSIFASTGFDSKIKFWSIDISNPKNILYVSTLEENSYKANTFDFHLTIPLLATAGYDHEIKIWLLNQSGTDTNLLLNLVGHSQIVKAVKFHETTPYLVSGGCDNTIKLWLFNNNYTNAICVASLDCSSPVYTISLHKSGLIACGTHNGSINIWQIDENNKNAIYKTTINKNENYISYLEFNNNTENIVLASCGDKIIKLWR